MSRLAPGAPLGPGVRWDGSGLEIGVRSRHAGRIEFCVFDETGTHELERHELSGRDGDLWHGRLQGAGPGLVYGLRAHGEYAPRDGHRFNPHKLLIDPYARELVGAFRWDDSVLGYRPGHPDGCDSFDARDSAPFVPKARVAAPAVPRGVRPPSPARPWDETVIYETHVRGFSIRHPGIAAPLRGTIEAFAQPGAIAHLRRLGVTAVELLPVAAWIDELHLVRRGLVNYWGYNPIAFLAMQPALVGPRGAAGVVATVDALHEAGIEVILDVVYNHTAEGDERGPTLSFRGLDNASYYVPEPGRPGRYRNLTGCGNTLAAHDPIVGDLIVDALRFWADEVGVDGFRFDLASAIARDAHGRFDPSLPWLRALRDDPVLSRRKLVAEAWDCEGWFTGGFPDGWSEWNDRWRDDARRFWRGDAHGVGSIATRLAGSSDLFGVRGPTASINFATAHDGFTLADWTAYRHRRNEANGEDNRDGAAENWSDDCGAEGPTDDPAVLRRRTRRARAMLATLMLSRGVPMLRAGDEFGATQDGNNNAYCQDGTTTWLRWPADEPAGDGAAEAPHAAGAKLLADPDHRPLIAALARLRAALPCLRGARFLEGRPSPDAEALPDAAWLRADASPMREDDWRDGARRGLALQLDAGVPYPGAPHDRVWIALVADEGPWTFAVPETPHADGWVRVLDTAADAPDLEVGPARTVSVEGPAVVVCVAGRPAREERARWRAGLPPAAFVDAGDPGAAIELAVPASSEPFVIALREERAAGGAGADGVPVAREITVTGREARVEARTVEGRRVERLRVPLGGALPPGTATLRPVRGPSAAVPAAGGRVFAAPDRCWLPEAIDRPRGAWALSVQVYGLRSASDWGIGDFDALVGLAERTGAIGACGLLLSPLHAPSFGWIDRGSPYSPSSRLALNPLFVSLPRAGRSFAAPRFDAWCARPETRARIDAVRAAPDVDYPAVVALKREAFERLWADFRATRTTALTRRAAQDFDAWRGGDGARLRPHLLFEALAERHGVADRRAWPAGFEHPDAPAVRAFERDSAERIGFHAFVQWLAARQWRELGEAAARAGASVGPIADLAVGADPAGADAWSRPGLVADDAEVGAPPDAFSADGQAWGLPPWRPEVLQDEGLAPFVELLRATMGGAGGLRIDHVMALERVFWVPGGGRAVDGAYVGYPLEPMLAALAAESARHRCLVLGEDLGTVRPGLRERLARAAVLSYRVAWFERDRHGRLQAPHALPARSAVCASTHDLPSIDGFARALDVDEREALGAIDAGTARRLREARARDVAAIVAGLDAAGLPGADLAERLHRWLAASTSGLAIVQLEDVAGRVRQPNLPGTPDRAPNWRQKLEHPVEALPDVPRFAQLASIFAARHATIGG
ncbi:MAG TPA: glycogen debranching protein GlgX [Burkholderiaceae bacterium]|nr:glycogen debranching protein GlgX [Burkholderiaceae bacterium]